MVNDNVVDCRHARRKKPASRPGSACGPRRRCVQIDAQVETVEPTGPASRRRCGRSAAVALHGPRPDAGRSQAAGAHLRRRRPGGLRPGPVHRGAAPRGRRRSAPARCQAPEANCPSRTATPSWTRVAAAHVAAAVRGDQGDAQGQPQPVRQHAAAAGGRQARQADAGRRAAAAGQVPGRAWASTSRRSRSAAGRAAATADTSRRGRPCNCCRHGKRPDFAAYKAALPVLGVDGTLADVGRQGQPRPRQGLRQDRHAVAGHDLLNDRSLLRSKALAGVMTTAKGTDSVLAMFVNDVPLPKGVPTPAARARCWADCARSSTSTGPDGAFPTWGRFVTGRVSRPVGNRPHVGNAANRGRRTGPGRWGGRGRRRRRAATAPGRTGHGPSRWRRRP